MHRLIAIAPGYNENHSPASPLHVVRELASMNFRQNGLGVLALRTSYACFNGATPGSDWIGARRFATCGGTCTSAQIIKFPTTARRRFELSTEAAAGAFSRAQSANQREEGSRDGRLRERSYGD